MSLIFRDVNFDAPVFIINNAVSDDFCKATIKEFKDKCRPATHQAGDEWTSNEKEMRSSNVAWFTNHDLFKLMWEHMLVANYSMGLRYKMTGAEVFQFTKYEDTTKDHYDWHSDGQSDHFAARNFTFGEAKNLSETGDPHLAGTVRKISASVMLNDDFKGGEFQVRWFQNKEVQVRSIPAKKGYMIIFPSWLEHRVKPVTENTRYSVVVWYAGPPLV